MLISDASVGDVKKWRKLKKKAELGLFQLGP